MRTFLVLAALAVVLTVPASASARAQSSVAAHASKYGRILFDGRGFALYTFTRDEQRGRSNCAGACAKKWPPYVVGGRPAAGAGAKASLIGTIRRNDGRLQATYAGRPLYYYVGDKKPGQILCQGVSLFGGLWFVVRPDGHLVR
jgi:predicted lipoprotein with Yx(FWY)xxD motif